MMRWVFATLSIASFACAMVATHRGDRGTADMCWVLCAAGLFVFWIVARGNGDH